MFLKIPEIDKKERSLFQMRVFILNNLKKIKK